MEMTVVEIINIALIIFFIMTILKNINFLINIIIPVQTDHDDI